MYFKRFVYIFKVVGMVSFLNILLVVDLSFCILGLVFVSGGFLVFLGLFLNNEGLVIVFEVCDFFGNFFLVFFIGLIFFVVKIINFFYIL